MNGSSLQGQIVLDLFEKYYERVFMFVRRSLPRGEAEDIAQQVFVKLMEIKEIEQRTLSVSYLIKIADNLIKRRYLRAQRFGRYVVWHGSRFRAISPSTNQGPDAEKLDQHLHRLSPDERDAVRLIICEGLSYEEAALAMDVPISTVNNWKHRGLRKLRTRFDARAGDGKQTGGDMGAAAPHRRVRDADDSRESGWGTDADEVTVSLPGSHQRGETNPERHQSSACSVPASKKEHDPAI